MILLQYIDLILSLTEPGEEDGTTWISKYCCASRNKSFLDEDMDKFSKMYSNKGEDRFSVIKPYDMLILQALLQYSNCYIQPQRHDPLRFCIGSIQNGQRFRDRAVL
jgi:hypothetical protein